jgi:hypothetical protein
MGRIGSHDGSLQLTPTPRARVQSIAWRVIYYRKKAGLIDQSRAGIDVVGPGSSMDAEYINLDIEGTMYNATQRTRYGSNQHQPCTASHPHQAQTILTSSP